MGFSLLFNNDSNQGITYNHELINDLQLDELCNFLCGDYIKPESFLSLLCTKGSDIAFRQGIVKDLINNQDLLDSFYSVSEQIEQLKAYKKLHDDRKELWIKYDLLYQLLVKYVECLDIIIQGFKLSQNINSIALTSFKHWISTKYQEENIDLLKEKLMQVEKDYKYVKGLIAGINVSEDCEPQSFTIEKLIYEDLTYTGIHKKSESSAGIFSINPLAKFDGNTNGQILSLFLNKKLEKLLKNQTNLIKNNLTQFQNINFSDLIILHTGFVFYNTAIKWYKYLNSSKSKAAQPIVCNEGFKIYAKECFSPILAIKMSPDEISANDIYVSEDINIITGANSSGKTTTLKTIALNHFLFCAGFHVCAESAEFSVPARVFSAFSTGEELEDSRFGMEVVRIQKILDISGNNSIMFLNEPFASTNPEEGICICKDIIKKLYHKGVKVIAVTHYYDLYNLLKSEGLNVESLLMKDQYVNAEKSASGKFRYKLMVQAPDGVNFAKEIAEQFGFSIEKILGQHSINVIEDKYLYLKEIQL